MTTEVTTVERRGWSWEEAVHFCGGSAEAFDAQIRPYLAEFKLGVRVIFDKYQVIAVMERFWDTCSKPTLTAPQQTVVEPNRKKTKWENERLASTRTKKAPGKSTNGSTAYDFESASQLLKTQKRG